MPPSEKKFSKTNLTLQLMALEKEEQTKAKIIRKGDMIKARGRELSTIKAIYENLMTNITPTSEQ